MDLILFFAGSFILTYSIIPKIIKVVKYKKLLDEPNSRSSHKSVTPTLGGIAFFCTIILSLFFLKKWDVDTVIINLTTSLTILFIIGLKDDLVAVSAITKLSGQILAIVFLLSNNFLVINSFNNFLGINEINSLLVLVFSGFIILYIINSYNLIDGVDGLASSIGIIILFFYGIIFFILGHHFYLLLTSVVIGVLLAFLIYNFSEQKKIFMGDTGSMIIGFLLGVLTLKLLNIEGAKFQESFKIIPENFPVFIGAILCIPLLDTVRVFFIRIINKKSFFVADTNHIHHVFLNMGFSHKKITLTMLMITICFVFIVFILSFFLSSALLFISFVFISLLFYLLLFYLNIKYKKKQ